MSEKMNFKRGIKIVLGFVLLFISICLIGRIDAQAYVDSTMLMSEYQSLYQRHIYSEANSHTRLSDRSIKVEPGKEKVVTILNNTNYCDTYDAFVVPKKGTIEAYVDWNTSGNVRFHIRGVKPGKVRLNIVLYCMKTSKSYAHYVEVTVTDPGKSLKKKINDPEKNNWNFELMNGKGSKEILLKEYIGKKKDVVVPKKIGKYTVVLQNMENRGSDPFKGNKKIKSISFEKGFKTEYLPQNFCEGCVNLKKITLPEGLIEIPCGAFKDCKNLKSITLPKSLRFISYVTYSGEWNLPFEGSGIKEIKIKSGNKNLFTKNNVIYSRETKRALIQAPEYKRSSIKVPKGIREVDCIFLNDYVKEINSPTYCTVENTGSHRWDLITEKEWFDCNTIDTYYYVS